jgi:signal transduction histidine kinase
MTNIEPASQWLPPYRALKHKNVARLRYGLAIAAAVAALLLHWAVSPYLGPLGSFTALSPAVAFVAYYLGTGPALTCTFIGLVGVNYWFLEALHSSSQDLVLSFAFLVAATLLIILGRSSRRNLSDLKRSEAKLNQAHKELETKVEDRTQQLVETVANMEREIEVRIRAEAQLKELSARVLRLQDEERRHIARELHDSVGQTLSALKMTLGSFERLVTDIPKANNLLCDLTALADQGLQEIRTTSYLLHPPLLDHLGFTAAAGWYVEGFSKRSGIASNVELASLRLSNEAELAFFRILQESLTNVLRHSGSKTVDIRFESNHENVVLSVRDHGRGVPPERLRRLNEAGTGGGVGWSGMRERLEQMGGSLRIESDGSGTCITAALRMASAVQLRSESEQASAASA